ncbi:hypothetical protein B0H66DRAFT_102025 [Apodospora peruviana]|uniref:Uncharacterized protein n=1 Tax=Apodospora peruviana TaxID=516989 RepID=A0AAE0HS67_9PEZI|nr:hypothetical protein B0H66DRAFT_102025 [Apodospora peruviana]
MATARVECAPTPTDACKVPNWTVQNISVTYSNDTYTPGSATFNVTNSVTSQVETITCPLSFNTLCRLDSTPLDPTLGLYFQVNLGGGVISFNQTWTCETNNSMANPSLPSFVQGSGEFELACPEEVTEDMTCTGLTTGSLLVTGAVVTPIPEPPEIIEDEDQSEITQG